MAYYGYGGFVVDGVLYVGGGLGGVGVCGWVWWRGRDFGGEGEEGDGGAGGATGECGTEGAGAGCFRGVGVVQVSTPEKREEFAFTRGEGAEREGEWRECVWWDGIDGCRRTDDDVVHGTGAVFL